ncbi:hypothetical protein K491DRAFT_222530 [Lophiostoma macrostomum CBS 122681]|uniref:Uncharacterized protein n=1 Tax=Lophiostoma macrostomum CBS 122681 TaxID=1314788 RepID=A0A6A6SM49_9PLEO|nr:hypothetical protein K491DRAFT_222530 [Lophiostoma macrostomum CBS 122681]
MSSVTYCQDTAHQSFLLLVILTVGYAVAQVAKRGETPGYTERKERLNSHHLTNIEHRISRSCPTSLQPHYLAEPMLRDSAISCPTSFPLSSCCDSV